MDYVEIPLNSIKYPGLKAIIDKEDYDRVNDLPWHPEVSRTTVYVRTSRNSKTPNKSLHRFIMNAKPGQVVDHINFNGLDNRKANLRFCSVKENADHSRKYRDSTSNFKGVSWQMSAQKWRAQIQAEPGRLLYLGSFIDETEAAKVYDQKAKELFGEFAVLNFPDKPIALDPNEKNYEDILIDRFAV